MQVECKDVYFMVLDQPEGSQDLNKLSAMNIFVQTNCVIKIHPYINWFMYVLLAIFKKNAKQNSKCASIEKQLYVVLIFLYDLINLFEILKYHV